MKRITIGLVAAATGLFMLAGCTGTTGGGTTPTGTDSSAAATNAGGTIKIGLNYELSGNVASYGEESVKGVELAADEINAAGGINGKQIELIKLDNKSDEAESTTVATKLITQDKVVAVIGPATSGRFKASIPVANANKVPVISGSATAEDVTVDAQGNVQPYVFRTCFADSVQGTAMANFVVNELKGKTALIIKDTSSDYAVGLAQSFSDTLKAAGGSIVGEEGYVQGDTDFNSILTKAKAMTYDVIYLPGYYNEVGLIIKAARELGITAPILGADGYDSPTLLALGGASALNDVYFTNHYSSLDQDPTVVKFIAAFKAKYNAEPNAFNAMGYDSLRFVADALTRSDGQTGPALADALASTKDFPGVTGKFTIDAKHNAIKDIMIIGLKDGVQSTSVRIPASS